MVWEKVVNADQKQLIHTSHGELRDSTDICHVEKRYFHFMNLDGHEKGSNRYCNWRTSKNQ